MCCMHCMVWRSIKGKDSFLSSNYNKKLWIILDICYVFITFWHGFSQKRCMKYYPNYFIIKTIQLRKSIIPAFTHPWKMIDCKFIYYTWKILKCEFIYLQPWKVLDCKFIYYLHPGEHCTINYCMYYSPRKCYTVSLFITHNPGKHCPINLFISYSPI